MAGYPQVERRFSARLLQQSNLVQDSPMHYADECPGTLPWPSSPSKGGASQRAASPTGKATATTYGPSNAANRAQAGVEDP